MAGVRSTLKWDDTDAQRMLRDAARRCENLSPVMKSFGEHMMVSTGKRFDTETAPDGTPWAPLSPATLRVKKGGKILQEMGRRGGLLGTIVYQAEARKIAIGTNKVYGAIHQLGGMAGRNRKVKIPARPYLGFNADDIRELAATAADYVAVGRIA